MKIFAIYILIHIVLLVEFITNKLCGRKWNYDNAKRFILGDDTTKSEKINGSSIQVFTLANELEDWGCFHNEGKSEITILELRKRTFSLEEREKYHDVLFTRDAAKVIEFCHAQGELLPSDYKALINEPEHPVYREVNHFLRSTGYKELDLSGVGKDG